jgi:hypothetical protein
MPFDFAADSEMILQDISNCDVAIGMDEIRGIFDGPTKLISTFGESVQSSDPQVTVLQSDIDRLAIRNGTVMTITLDSSSGVATDYLVKQPGHDGAGLTTCTLKKV